MFERAFSRFLYGRTIPKPTGPSIKEKFRKRNDYMRYHRLAEGQQPNLGQHKDLKLMDFQIDGVNWLCTNWWNSQHCILADEMGLVSLVYKGSLCQSLHILLREKQFKLRPSLVL
jgi:chromodomain-helicase-DNA-binding protein 4